jgi:hypothetical protein
MPLFDFYVMVDWSGGAIRRGGRDTIWIAHGSRTRDVPLTCNPYSRTEAVYLIRSLLVEEVRSKRRVLSACTNRRPASLTLFTKNVLDPAIGNEPHHGDHRVDCDRYPGTNKGQHYRRSVKHRGYFALYVSAESISE